MQSFADSEYDTSINLYALLADLLTSKCFEIDERTKLLLRKACLQLTSHSYELQVSLAAVYRKFHQQLEPPNWQDLNLQKGCELEWLKVSLLKEPNKFRGQTTAKLLRAYKELLEENVLVTCSLLTELTNSNTYILQKYAVLFLQKTLLESAYDPEQARLLLLTLLKSEHDAIALGAIHVLEEHPILFNQLPEKLFWILSDRSEIRLQALVNILWLWGDSQLVERILEGESWSIPLKKGAILWSSKYPSQKYLEQLFNLLKTHPATLGYDIMNALKTFKLSGLNIHHRGIQAILKFYAEYPLLETDEAAFLTKNASEKNLRTFCENHIHETSFLRIVELLSALDNSMSDQIMIDLFEGAQSNFERNILLDVFKQRGANTFESVVLKWFEKNPIKSVQVLNYLGGDATAKFLLNRLKQESPKVDIHKWEEPAVKLIFQISANSSDLLKTLVSWKVPYLPSIVAEVKTEPTKSLVSLLNLQTLPCLEEHELSALYANIATRGTQYDLDFLTEGLVHDSEAVRSSALSNIDALIERLYHDKRIEPRVLLKYSSSSATNILRSELIVNQLLTAELDAQQQDILADFLLKKIHPNLLEKHFEALTRRGNLHFEKRLIEAIGETRALHLSAHLKKYLNQDQDIFRLRQAIIAAEKLKAQHLEKDISPFLVHRNMNIRKTAASFLQYCGSQWSAPSLLHILKTQDNVGLRGIVKQALSRILKERYSAFIYNALRTCKSDRETSLLIQALSDQSRLWVVKGSSLHGLPMFHELVEDAFTIDEDHYRNEMSSSGSGLREASNELRELINESNGPSQSAFRNKVKALTPWEKAVLFEEVRQHLEQEPRPLEFLLEVLAHNNAVLSDALAIRALGTQSNSIISYALRYTLLLYHNYNEAVAHLPDPIWQPHLVKYFYAAQNNEVQLSIGKESTKTWNGLTDLFEDWEYLTLFNDFHSHGQLPTFINIQFQNTRRHRKDFLHFIFENAETDSLTALLSVISKEEVYEHFLQIQDLYNKANEQTRVFLLQKLGRYPLIVHRLIKNTIGNTFLPLGEGERSVVSRNDLAPIRAQLHRLLHEDEHLLFKNSEKVYGLVNLLKHEESVVTTVLSALVESNLLWSPTLGKVRHLLANVYSPLVWKALAPFVHQGHFGCLELLPAGPSINSEVLQAIRYGSDQVKTHVLDWLLNTSPRKFYFPELYEELCLVQPDDRHFNSTLRLLLQIEANTQDDGDYVFQHISRLLTAADKTQKQEILETINAQASTTFLRPPHRRTPFLELFPRSNWEQSVSCVLASINWHSAEDVQYVVDVLRAPSSTLETLKKVLSSIDTLDGHEQIAIYSKLLDIKNFTLLVQEAIMVLFSQDYQVIDLLSNTQRNGFLNACAQELSHGTLNSDLAIGICKSLSLVEFADYTLLMEELLFNHKSRQLRNFSLRELKKGASRKQYLNACMTILKTGDTALQSQAIKALSYAKQHQVVPLLIPLLFSKKSSVKKLSEQGILNIGSDAIRYLENELGKARPDRKSTIRELIQKLT